MKKLLLLALFVRAFLMQGETMTKLMVSPSGEKGVFQYDFNINEDGCSATVTHVDLIDSPLDDPTYERLFDNCFLAIPETMEVEGKRYIVTALGDPEIGKIVTTFYFNVAYLPKTTRRINRWSLVHSAGDCTYYFNGAEIDYLPPQTGIAPLYIYTPLDHTSTYPTTDSDRLFDLVLGKDFKADESLSSLDKTDRKLHDKIANGNYDFNLSYLPLVNCINLHVSPECEYYEEKDGCLYHRGCNDTILSVIATSAADDTASVVIPRQVKAITLPHAAQKFKQGWVNVSFEEGSQLEELGLNALSRTHIDALPPSLREYKENRFYNSVLDRQPTQADVFHWHAFYGVRFPNDSVLVIPAEASAVEENAYENTVFGLAKDGVTLIWSKNPGCTFTKQNLHFKEIHLEGTNKFVEGCFDDASIKVIYLNRKYTPEVVYKSSETHTEKYSFAALCNSFYPYSDVPLLYVPVGSLQYYKDWWLEEKVREWPFEILGDMNGDGNVDVADVDIAIDMVLGKTGFNAKADLNHNGKVDVADVNNIIDIVLGK